MTHFDAALTRTSEPESLEFELPTQPGALVKALDNPAFGYLPVASGAGELCLPPVAAGALVQATPGYHRQLSPALMAGLRDLMARARLLPQA